jgi:hypothetical protein
MDDRDKLVDQNSTTTTDSGEALPYYLPPGQPPLTEEEIAAGIEFSPLTGFPRFKARPGEPMITHEEVRKIYEEEFP